MPHALRFPGRFRLPWLDCLTRRARSEESTLSTDDLSPRERYWRDLLIRAYCAKPPLSSRPQ